MRQALRPAGIVIAVLAVTLFPMLYGNLVARKGGLLDDSLLNTKDPFYLLDRKAENLMAPGLRTSDAITLVVPLGSPISAEDLLRVQTLTRELKQAFPGCGVLSLSVVPRYRDTGEELLSEPYIHDGVIDAVASDAAGTEVWRREVSRDPSVYGVLIGRSFDYATVNVLLPRGYDEIATFRRIAGFLERRSIPWFEWFFKTDITPAPSYRDITVAGWATARGLMDAALTADVMTLMSAGLLIVGVVFTFSLRSRRQALLAILIVVLCFLWTRGSIGLLQQLGFQVYERVYVLLVYTAIIVSGISFVERKLECYNELRRESPGSPRPEIWRRSRKVVDGVIWVTAATAMANFGTLYQIGIRGILELGLFSALGIAYLLILVLWFLPALHTLTGGEAIFGRSLWFGRAADAWDAFLRQVVELCYRILDRGEIGQGACRLNAGTAIGITLGLTVLAAVIISLDYVPFVNKDFQFLEVKTKPLEYLPGTIVDRASKILNREGNYGFDRIPILVMPGEESDVLDPRFAARVRDLQVRLAEIPEIREVSSVLDIASVISRESYKGPLPRTRSELHDALQLIEWDLGQEVKEHLWSDRALIVFASFSAVDSNLTGEIIQGIIGLARDRFPDLQVLPFGKFATYPQTDRYIREGKPINLLTSQWIVVVLCGVWVMWRHRTTPRALHAVLRLSPWRTGMAVSIPFVFASAFIALVMVALRVPLDQATACITALAVNAAIDFSLYMVADYQTALLSGKSQRESVHFALTVKGRIIVIDILLNCLCFAPLMASRFIPVARMGWIMIVMLLACGFGSLVLLPALLPACTRPAAEGDLLNVAEEH
jgi:predicted RND superfamily exporter protein